MSCPHSCSKCRKPTRNRHPTSPPPEISPVVQWLGRLLPSPKRGILPPKSPTKVLTPILPRSTRLRSTSGCDLNHIKSSCQVQISHTWPHSDCGISTIPLASFRNAFLCCRNAHSMYGHGGDIPSVLESAREVSSEALCKDLLLSVSGINHGPLSNDAWTFLSLLQRLG